MGNDQSSIPTGAETDPTPAPAPAPLLDENWRPINFLESTKHRMMEELRNLKISNPEVQHLRVLVLGPVGAGNSSLISSIDSIFKGRMAQTALVEADMNCLYFTKTFQTYKIKDRKTGTFLPFVISDIMGLQNRTNGAHIDDIIMALKGHVKDGYRLNPEHPLDKDDLGYNSSPTLSDGVHCLVTVIPADKFSLMVKHEDVICKLRAIRQEATEMRIPQVVVMTKVDEACHNVRKDLRMVYKSKRIKERMQGCSNKLGHPMNAIFPVKNYHEEIDLDNDMDILLLTALRNIVSLADDYVGEHVNT